MADLGNTEYNIYLLQVGESGLFKPKFLKWKKKNEVLSPSFK